LKIIFLKKIFKFKKLRKYNWFIEGKGRLQSEDSVNYKTYNQDEIVKDGSISLVIVIDELC